MEQMVRDIIQSLWIGDRLSAMEQLSIRSFMSHGHPYHLYVYNTVQDIPAGVRVLDASEILPVSRVCKTPGVCGVGRSYAPFADLFRYKLLALRGGWWVDTDFICMKPFDFSIPYVFTGDGDGVNPALMKVPTSNDPFMTWVYEQTEKVFHPEVPWGVTGSIPAVGVRKFSLMQYRLDTLLFCPINEQALLATSLGVDNKDRIDQAYAIHCYNELWRIAGADKDGHHSPTCLYEQLLRKHGVRQ